MRRKSVEFILKPVQQPLQALPWETDSKPVFFWGVPPLYPPSQVGALSYHLMGCSEVDVGLGEAVLSLSL